MEIISIIYIHITFFCESHNRDIKKEKGVFFESQMNLCKRPNGALTSSTPLAFDDGLVYNMPPHFDRFIPENSLGKVSVLRKFLKSCLALVKDEQVIRELHSL